MGFFQICWEILKDDLMKVFQEFYSFGKFEKCLNTTFLALVPKRVGYNITMRERKRYGSIVIERKTKPKTGEDILMAKMHLNLNLSYFGVWTESLLLEFFKNQTRKRKQGKSKIKSKEQILLLPFNSYRDVLFVYTSVPVYVILCLSLLGELINYLKRGLWMNLMQFLRC
ncbi:hypothetical protein I3842_01G111400 [Carya illinoinensis]|uniref:Uncharacterized protein n=1 Tax=Carya illinoinensis TaxID=32201 RepID=A0A922FZ07_CARIL|nr:hypothetical protein I3842_01G111400 [Carya illinoinensis]